MKNGMSNGKLKDCLAYFFDDANFGGSLSNSYPYLVLENSKFETKTSKLWGHVPSVLTIISSNFTKTEQDDTEFDSNNTCINIQP